MNTRRIPALLGLVTLPLASDKPEFSEHVTYGKSRVATLEALAPPP